MSGIMMAAMAGVRPPVPNPLPARSAVSSVISPATAAASLTFTSNGLYSSTGEVDVNWYLPTTAAIGNGYWVRANITGDAPAGPASGAWSQLNINRTWSLSQSSVGTKTCTLSLAIATDAGGTNIIATGTATIFVEVSL